MNAGEREALPLTCLFEIKLRKAHWYSREENLLASFTVSNFKNKSLYMITIQYEILQLFPTSMLTAFQYFDSKWLIHTQKYIGIIFFSRFLFLKSHQDVYKQGSPA